MLKMFTLKNILNHRIFSPKGTFRPIPERCLPSTLNLVPYRQFTSIQMTHSHSAMLCQSPPSYKLNGTLVSHFKIIFNRTPKFKTEILSHAVHSINCGPMSRECSLPLLWPTESCTYNQAP